MVRTRIGTSSGFTPDVHAVAALPAFGAEGGAAGRSWPRRLEAAGLAMRDDGILMMRFAAAEVAPPLARWASRAAFFSVGLFAAAAFLHRLFAMQTAVALNVVATSFLFAGLALLLAIVAGVQIWRSGRPGTARVVTASVVSLGMLGWPLAFVPTLRTLPMINDLTTDAASPPPFVALAAARGQQHTAYPARFAKRQAAAYPDIVPIEIERSEEEAYDVVLKAVKTILKLKTVREEPPAGDGHPGYIEAVDRTLVFGFYDDIAVRVSGDENHARIDLRSASRVGKHDFGRNADRLRRLLKTIVAQLEASVRTASGEQVGWKRAKKLRAVPKRLKGADQTSGGHGKAGARGRSDAQRGPGQKVRQPSPDERRGRGRRSGQSFE